MQAMGANEQFADAQPLRAISVEIIPSVRFCGWYFVWSTVHIRIDK